MEATTLRDTKEDSPQAAGQEASHHVQGVMAAEPEQGEETEGDRPPFQRHRRGAARLLSPLDAKPTKGKPEREEARPRLLQRRRRVERSADLVRQEPAGPVGGEEEQEGGRRQ